VRLAALGDVHCRRASRGLLQPLFAAIADGADVLLLCGDLTDNGLPEEAELLARELAVSVKKIPVIAVLGNHDYESNKAPEVTQILTQSGITVLDGDATEVRGIGFAGTKGFCGGFAPYSLQPWGESIIKEFVREALDESLKLESALAKLRTKQRVALLHYSPIQSTVEGEPPPIYPFLGSGRLEEPINRYRVSAVFHGHAHHGQPEGRTHEGIPVYNVAMPLMLRVYPQQPPFRIVELRVELESGGDGAAGQS
jgi:Icc-related predicted phosphoesterase